MSNHLAVTCISFRGRESTVLTVGFSRSIPSESVIRGGGEISLGDPTQSVDQEIVFRITIRGECKGAVTVIGDVVIYIKIGTFFKGNGFTGIGSIFFIRMICRNGIGGRRRELDIVFLIYRRMNRNGIKGDGPLVRGYKLAAPCLLAVGVKKSL